MILDHFALSHICDNCPERVKFEFQLRANLFYLLSLHLQKDVYGAFFVFHLL